MILCKLAENIQDPLQALISGSTWQAHRVFSFQVDSLIRFHPRHS